MIRVVKETDAVHIAKIYNHYILNTLITFEEQPVTPEPPDGRNGRHIGAPWRLRSTSMCRLPGGT